MKAIILLGTLKKTEESNTQTLSEFFTKKLIDQGIECETIKLVDHKILPGTYSDMGKGDAWPKILKKVLAADMILFATPVWWGNHSSEIQRVIERIDEIHDGILKGMNTPFEGKTAGIIVTGDGDGAEHIIGNIANYCNAIGLLIPPFGTLTVLWNGHGKDKKTSKKELLKKYEKEYAKTAKKMITQMTKFVSVKTKN